MRDLIPGIRAVFNHRRVRDAQSVGIIVNSEIVIAIGDVAPVKLMPIKELSRVL